MGGRTPPPTPAHGRLIGRVQPLDALAAGPHRYSIEATRGPGCCAGLGSPGRTGLVQERVHSLGRHRAPLRAGKGGGKEPQRVQGLCPRQPLGGPLTHQDCQPGSSQRGTAANQLHCLPLRADAGPSGRGKGGSGSAAPLGAGRARGVPGRRPLPRREAPQTGRLLRKSIMERGQAPAPRAACDRGLGRASVLLSGLGRAWTRALSAPLLPGAPPTPGRRRGRGGRGANGEGQGRGSE